MDEEMIQKIKNLKDQIIDPKDVGLYEEALACLNARAYRASYIMFWLSCAESLKRKFKDAASTGDSSANNHYSELCNNEKQYKAIDKTLLSKAKEYGFIDDFEHGELNNIMVIRSVCAHPYEIAPDITSIHFAATRVVKYVLSRPTELGEKYIDNLLLNLQKPQFLPQDEVKALLSRLSRIAPRHLFYAYKKTIEELKSIPQDNSPIINRYKIVLSILAKEIPTEIKSSKDFHDLICSDPKHIFSSISPKMINDFGKDNRECLIKYLYSNKNYKYLQTLYENGILDNSEKVTFKGMLNTISVSDMYRNSIRLQLVIENLIGKLRSGSFSSMNTATDYIESHLEQVIGLGEDIQIELGNLIFSISSDTGTDYDGSAQRATKFMKNISRNIPPQMALGIFKEMFDVKEKTLCVKKTYIDFDSLAEILSSNFSEEELQKHFDGLETIQLADINFISKIQTSKLAWIASILNGLSKNMRHSE